MSAAAVDCGSWQLLCSGLGMFAVCPIPVLTNSLDPSAPDEAYSRNSDTWVGRYIFN